MSDKPDLDKYIQYGIHGTPELKKEERARFLNNFRERVIKALTIKQVEEEGTYKEILQAIKDPRACKLVVSGDVKLQFAMEYVNLARQHNLQFTISHNPGYKGDIGLVVVGECAVDEENIFAKK